MSTALVCLPRGLCPSCGAGLRSLVWDQPALFRYGGYGASLRTTVFYCPACLWSGKPDRSEVNPRG